MTETIYARSSGAPPAAIAIVRVSGPGVRSVAEHLLRRVPQPREATLVSVRDPISGERLDRALALFFPTPASATGEDVLELHLHGGRALVAAVERTLSKLPGVREAEPGEFTRRAVANGRLDLLETEALGELLAADTELHRRAAITGGSRLRMQVELWRNTLLALAADVETAIDQDIEIDEGALREHASALAASIGALFVRPPIERLRDGFLVVIGGPPNAGKSTLFNALLGDDAAIVSPEAGTTRDVIERVVTIGGLPVRLADTAGRRTQGDSTIEAIGIERATALATAADLLLWLDRSPSPTGVDTIRVQSQLDVLGDMGWADVCVSGRTGAGLDDLVASIQNRLEMRLPPPGEALVNARQRKDLFEAADALQLAAREKDLVLVAAEVARARRAFDRLTGRAGIDDLLDAVFARFCLGK